MVSLVLGYSPSELYYESAVDGLSLDVLKVLMWLALGRLGTAVDLVLFLDMLGLVDVLVVDRDFELVGFAVTETGRLDVFQVMELVEIGLEMVGRVLEDV